ncbi:MAG: 30S ribosomal protein S12 methylthiotransferase RimO [Planctomycetes bacterium]|nr:30S ribosomal protein S12 methylthiotransferase RimO [Planctomycetota bacterium]MBU4399945.1 30S ribosomal protein S12 methylthiotransferase RimO [Planctomycetota bacterium]MCG2684436.1 30S ribosomal protein S12 methylthiotransferase RimO [Planctomycetales bacterium]
MNEFSLGITQPNFYLEQPLTARKVNIRRTFALISLGCPKNLVDSERMAGLLHREGYRMVAEADGADLAVVNTCGFIDDARAESYQTIEEMLRLKERGRLRWVIIAGCLAERDRETLFEKYPELDQLIGVFARDEIAVAARQLEAGKGDAANLCEAPFGPFRQISCVPFSRFRPPASPPLTDNDRRRITLPHVAYLKIAEGCNRLCSFCSIPRMRGPYSSKPIDRVAAEAEELVADGVRELVLVAQDTTFYGLDIDGRPRLAELLRRLDEVRGLDWIRLMYLYPMHVTDELIETIAGGKRILPYLDIPLQHINDEVLRRMRRRVGREDTKKLIDRLRERIESLVLRTTMMTGFPGETEEQFEELVEFVRRRRFERLGVFDFRDEPGTPSVELDGHLPKDVRVARRDRLMAVQQEITFEWNASWVGKRLEAIIDRRVPGREHAYIGRGYADAPEVDGQVYVTGEGLEPGKIVACEVVAAKGYDLIAVA